MQLFTTKQESCQGLDSVKGRITGKVSYRFECPYCDTEQVISVNNTVKEAQAYKCNNWDCESLFNIDLKNIS